MLTESLFTRTSALRLSLVVVIYFLCYSLWAQQASPGADGKNSFTARLMNIEAPTNETFRYTATLHNGSPVSRVYELKTDLPAGWQIAYRVEGSLVRSLNLDSGKSQDISIEVNAATAAKPDKYRLPVKAVSEADTLLLNLEAVVKGSYALELTTPTGRLSEEITSGSSGDLQLVVKNSGSLPLNELELSGQLPPQWESTFEPAKIQQLEPGKTATITVRIKVPDKTIAGDYAGTLSVKNTNSTAQANFRLVVTTSLLSGWIGVLVILAAIALVYYLVRKYGRR
ncbi:NEW3 domain-containing protein [Niabella yanshanensis]|uniref:NEW3 domain-containing protein n=1 Tax=Niabella yanshanensis TaxID=577386 RepID=A0ABZ0W4Q4_9BACT|nr:NEW3 domain-containing protein [Niabella yanshanensis]WQD38238.1 NEW3 domain-containing protein [Niabella yanshanensis]